jgi:HAD superfamily hydrolase (TIGR01509 family)
MLSFFYFDMGNVLLNFSHERGARQMAEVAGCSPESVWDLVFAGDDLEDRCERGDLNARGLYDLFCKQTKTQADFELLERAGCDIFELNLAMVPLISHLRSAGYRLGILSNTSESHWNFVTDGRFGILPKYFDEFVLSYEVRSMKPERKIYDEAIRKAGVPASEIFFCDDRPDNVAGALAAGLDAVQFHTAQQLGEELYARGVRTNY